MSDTILRTMQADVAGLLKAVPGLALAQVISADDGLTEADVARKLSTLSGTEKIGLACVVLQPEIPSAERNLPGPRVRVEQSIQVIEHVIINRDATNGTQIPCNVAAMRVLAALHQQIIGESILYADRNPVEPLPGQKGYVTYVVTLAAEQLNASTVERADQVGFALDNTSELVLSCATASAAIYYTTDGSFPAASNPEAILYADPITITDGLQLRAAAYLAPLNPSHVSNVTVRILSDEISLNNMLVTMGGEPILLL